MLRCDLLVINKIDLAPHVGVDLPLMCKEADEVRGGRPVVATNARDASGIDELMDVLEREVLFVVRTALDLVFTRNT